jgi:chitodextrinase
MTRRNFKVRFWLGLAAAAVTLGLPAAAQAGTNVVPNPGFEQGGCGNTPVICGWETSDPNASISGDAPHSGNASLLLNWGTDDTGGSFTQWWGAYAGTNPAFCAAIGPGAHPASFWYLAAAGELVSMSVAFYQTPDCTGSASYDSLGAGGGDGWLQSAGAVVAPAGTQSGLFSVGVFSQCDNYSGCSALADFDDLDVEDSSVTTPTISSFTPASGRVGTSVDIVGVNFTGASSVTFDGTPARFTVDSDSEIHATVPDGATTGRISVTTPSGTSASRASFGVAPTISSFTPTCGPAGARVDILGTSFNGATRVTFAGSETSFTVDSDSEIHATVPSGWTLGAVSVTTPGGTGTSASSFAGPCNSPPAINSLTPSSGPVGTGVDIQGANFTGATSVEFDGTNAGYSVDSDSEIQATVPSGATTGPISVTTPSGTAISSSSFTVIVNAPPVARFSFSCSALTCSYDGTASSDPDGTIRAYSWDFGDGTGGSGQTATRVYGQASSYTVTLTVTDNAGATATASHAVTLIALSARGYKVKGLEKVDLSWSGQGGTSFDVYRNGGKIATVQGGAYTDNINRKGTGTYTYKACAPAASTCSNQTTVSF